MMKGAEMYHIMTVACLKSDAAYCPMCHSPMLDAAEMGADIPKWVCPNCGKIEELEANTDIIEVAGGDE